METATTTRRLLPLLLLLSLWADARPIDKHDTVQRGHKIHRGTSAGAGTLLAWECPISRLNGDAFDCETDLQKYVIEITLGDSTREVDVGPTLTTYSITGAVIGTRYRVKACDTDDVCSEWSAAAYQF